eukprot:982658-Alexandrium_andersonii.AAC.1
MPNKPCLCLRSAARPADRARATVFYSPACGRISLSRASARPLSRAASLRRLMANAAAPTRMGEFVRSVGLR